MEVVIFVGIQGAGKSTFFKERFFDSHIRINLDMLRTRHREKLIFEACLEAKQKLVLDNTNLRIEEREKYIVKAKESGFKIIGYYFQTNLAKAIERNNRREGKAKISEKGLLGAFGRLQIPNFEEGFDELFYVWITSENQFVIEEWKNKIGDEINMANIKTSPEMDALKSKLKATWTAGDFGQIAKSYETGAGEFIKRLNLQSGMRVLDVACGTGNLSLPAARAGATVTGVDIAENLIEQARANAENEGLKIQFDVGDAENLSYDDASFDAVVTMFGAMFAPRPELAAAELIRVCRPGGFIAMANWTPTGFAGMTFKTIAKYIAPPPDMPSPVLWGDEATVRERLREGISELKTTPRKITFKYPFSPVEVVEHFRNYFGPTVKAFAAIDDSGQAALRHDLKGLWTEHNRAADGTTEVESEYLEVIAVRA
ncbi:MAG: methyltransferase domain-containing protein [Pyrinomonadaceae bacterium]